MKIDDCEWGKCTGFERVQEFISKNLFDLVVIEAATDAMPSDCVVVRQNYVRWDLLSPANQQFYYVVRSQYGHLASTEDWVHDCKTITIIMRHK